MLKIEEVFNKLANSCMYESFVVGPGDYSPPRCNCEKCITAGRSYTFTTGNIKLSEQLFKYFWSILIKEQTTKTIRAGIEYTLPGKCRILLQVCDNSICVEANKDPIRIGSYMCYLTSKIICHANEQV